MSYFKTHMGIGTKEDAEIVDLVEKYYGIDPQSLTSETDKEAKIEQDKLLSQFKQLTKDETLTWKVILQYPSKILIEWIKKHVKFTPDPDPEGWPTKRAAEIGLPKLVAGSVALVLTWLINCFVGIQLNKFAAVKMEEGLHNKKLYNWIKKTVDTVYTDHPEYTKFGLNKFKKTSLWQRFAAEWRDKTAKENVYNIVDSSFNLLLTKLCKFIPLPFFTGFMYCIAARFVLSYLGCKMGAGSLVELVIDFEGNSLHLGLTFTRLGFELTKPILYVERTTDRKMVKVNLPEIPKSVYKLDSANAKRILDSIGGQKPNLKKLKKEVARLNDLE